MATYSLKINISGTWYEYPVSRKGFKRSIKLYNTSLKPCLNSCKVDVKWTSTLWTLLMSSTENYPVSIMKDGTDFFVGLIPSTLKSKIQKVQTSISLSILDPAYILKTNVLDICFNMFKVCDPDDKENSIVHQLLYLSGYDDTLIDITERILTVITVFTAEEGKTTYWKLLEDLLYEYHHAFNSDPSGRFTLVDWGIRSLMALGSLGDTGFSISDLSINKKDRKYSSVELTWYKVNTILNALIFRDSIDPDDIGEAVLSGLSYPVVSEDEEVEQKYSAEWISGDDPELIFTSNHILETQFLQLKEEALSPEYITATDVVVSSVFDMLSAKIVIENNNIDTIWIKYLDIRADVIAKVKEVISYTSYDGTTKSYKSKYIEDVDAAKSFATSLDAFYLYCDSSVTFSSMDNLYEGGVYIIKYSRSSIDTKVIITQRVDSTSNIIKYTGIPVDNLVTKTVTTKEIQDELSQSLMIQRAVFEQMADRPTFNQLIQGHATYGQTMTPFKITDVKTESHLNCIEINWPVQVNLSNLKEYRLQISTDKTKWYSLGKGLGVINKYTTVQGAFYLHTNIPAILDGEDSIPATYFYRVAQVTVLEEVSDWSDSVLGETLLVEGDVLVTNSIKANHIRTGAIEADHIKAGAIDANAIGLLGQDLNPTVTMLDESVQWDLRNVSTNNLGEEIVINADVITYGATWSDGGDLPADDLDLDESLFNGKYTIGRTITGSFGAIKTIKGRLGNNDKSYFGGAL